MSSEEKKVNENAAADEAEKVEVNAEQVEDAVKEEKETEKTDKNEKAENRVIVADSLKEDVQSPADDADTETAEVE